MARATSSNGDKPERDELRRSMLASGHTTEDIANEMMQRWGFRPRAAWRHAHGWGQTEVAARYNQILGDSSAPMTNRRISDYENWPFGGVKPTINTLSLLAQVYGTSVANLVSPDDHRAFTQTESAALKGIAATQNVAPTQKISATFDTLSNVVPQQSLSRSNVIPQGNSLWSVKDLVDSVADETRSHAEMTQGYLMADSTIDNLTADVFALAHDRDNTPVLTMFSNTVQIRNRIYRLLEYRQRPQKLTQLYYLASIVSAFLTNFSNSLGMTQAAKEHAQASWTYAEMIGHNSLRFWARKKQAGFAYHENRPQRAIDILLSAQNWATEPLAQVVLNSSLAEKYVVIGNTNQARRSLTTALDTFQQSDGTSELFNHIGGIFSNPQENILHSSSKTYRELGDIDIAEQSASEAVRIYNSLPLEEVPYDRMAGTKINLAHTLLIAHGIEAAQETLQSVFTLPPNMRVGWVVEDLNILYSRLRKHPGANSAAGVQLGENIEAFSETTARDDVPNMLN